MILPGDSEVGFPIVVTAVKSSKVSGTELLSWDGPGH